MDSFGSGQAPYGFDRRREVVSGKGFGAGAGHTYGGRSGSPGPPSIAKPRPSLSESRSWGFDDPEMKRKKRIARYKAYTVEGKVKGALKKSLRWIKNKCCRIVRGY